VILIILQPDHDGKQYTLMQFSNIYDLTDNLMLVDFRFTSD